MEQQASGRRRGVRLLVIGLVLFLVGLFIAAWILRRNPSIIAPDPSGGGTDFAGIALLVTSLGGLITGVITAVTGLILALRKPKGVVDDGRATPSPKSVDPEA
jgi:hypothetical protein